MIPHASAYDQGSAISSCFPFPWLLSAHKPFQSPSMDLWLSQEDDAPWKRWIFCACEEYATHLLLTDNSKLFIDCLHNNSPHSACLAKCPNFLVTHWVGWGFTWYRVVLMRVYILLQKGQKITKWYWMTTWTAEPNRQKRDIW